MLALSQVCSGQVERLILRQVLILACTDIIEVILIINIPIDTDQLVLSTIFREVFLLVFFVKLDDDLF